MNGFVIIATIIISQVNMTREHPRTRTHQEWLAQPMAI
jgi:hypothetical protein